MLFSDRCIYAAQKKYPLFISVYRNVKFKHAFMPLRTFFKKKPTERASINRSSDDNGLRPLAGLDDDNFSHNFKVILTNPRLFKTALFTFFGNFKSFYNEEKERISKNLNPRLDDRRRNVDMLYTFETERDLKKFCVNTDSSFNMGYSSASLKLTNEGTALFSGNICLDVPKDGNVRKAGYANMLSLKEVKSFHRIKKHDWSEYTDLVLKIRGDGRTYLIIINITSEYEEIQYTAYGQHLYTRGGPYWQIAKMPFSHFFTMTKGLLHTHQDVPNELHKISTFGITASGYEGPFKLEIDYVGLEYDERFKTICPFESYK